MSNKKNATLLHHVIRQKMSAENAAGMTAGLREDSFSKEEKDRKVRMTETRIYVGLNDSETKEQKFSTDKYLDILKDVCKNYHLAFSVDVKEGGYFHEDGTYTEETSLVLILIDADRSTVQEIAKDLCAFFHQESVLVTEDAVQGYFVFEDALI